MPSILNVRRSLLAAFLMLVSISLSGREEERVFFSFDASNGLADNSAQTIKCTKTGRMVITTIGHINFYDGDAFTHIDPSHENIFPLPKYNGHYHLYFDRLHHLWLKDKHTVTCVDLLTERFITDVRGVLHEMGMQRPVDDMFGDVDSHLWFLSGKRLYNLDFQTDLPVASGAELQDVDVYAGRWLLQFYGDGNVSAYDLKTSRHLFDTSCTDIDQQAYAKSSVLCPDSNVYYQIRNGDTEGVLLSLDVETRQWRTLLKAPYHLNNMVIHEGRIYIASEYGYWTYDIQTGATEHIEQLLLSKGRKLNTDINTIAFDRQGGMWIGTEKRGLLYSRPFPTPFVAYTWQQPEALHYSQLMDLHLKSSEPLPRHTNCKYVDSRGWIWTGTYTGLQLLKGDSKSAHTYTRRDGLMNEMVHCVIEDAQHDIWVGTSYGISHLFIRNNEVHHIETYYNRDNVPNESFVNGRAMMLPDGTIVMQSLDHVVVFNPARFHADEMRQMTLYPKLIKLLVNGHNIQAGTTLDGRTILDRSITRAREVTVNYNQNSLSLTFSGLNYIRPIQTYYRFRVLGVYDEWQILSHSNSGGRVDSRGMLHLPLTGLRPGKYTIELQASTSPDDWPLEPFTWIVNVEEPWWRSTGIYLLLASVLLVFLLANFYYYNRNTRLRLLRNNEEGDILKRIRNYANRCDALQGEVLTPYSGSLNSQTDDSGDLSSEFTEVMLKIVPYFHAHPDSKVTMHDLITLTGLDMGTLYSLLAGNLYKSPRQLAGKLRLQQAADMLRTGTLPIEDIASQCGFVSPNYFISSFYHLYRQTPEAYRNSAPL